MQDDRGASNLKELQVHFKVNISTRAAHVFQKFRKNCSEYKESVNYLEWYFSTNLQANL